MSNTSDTPVFSSGDYLKIKAIKIHLGDTGMDENTPWQIPSLLPFLRSSPCSCLP